MADAPISRTQLKRLAVISASMPCPWCKWPFSTHADGLCSSPDAPEHLRRAAGGSDNG